MSAEERPNPYPPLLPQTLVLGHLVAAIGSFIKGTAWELGERFDAVLGHRFGPSWLVDEFGQHPMPDLYDPDFVFDRHPRDSILWEALPPYSLDLVERFGKARYTRNRWEHQAAQQTMHTFRNGIDQIHRLAAPLGLKTAGYAALMKERLTLLQQAGGVLPPTDLEVELRANKEAAEAARAAADAAAHEAAVAIAQAQAQGVATAQALEAKRRAEAAAAAAQDEIEMLETMLREAGRTSRMALLEPADDLQPGQPWGEIPLGIRLLRLNPYMIDLMDQATQMLLSQEMGPVAHEAARRWLAFMPEGGLVHLTPAGNAAGRVGAVYIYLGRLDEG
jgi:hypothetical protein